MTATTPFFVSVASTSEPHGPDAAQWECAGPVPAYKGQQTPFVYLRTYPVPPGSTPERAEEMGRSLATAAGFGTRAYRFAAPVVGVGEGVI